MEDFILETTLESALYTKEFKTFELLFNVCCKNGNSHFVYQVIMRNFDIIMTLRELDPVFENYFQDDLELGNKVTFGMRLIEECIPEY